MNTAEIITNAFRDPFFKKLEQRFRFCWLSYQNFLANLFSQCKVSLCERNTHDASSVGENCCSFSAQKTTKKNLSQDLLRNENTDSDLKASARAALCK